MTKIRLPWKDYKVVSSNNQLGKAWFAENNALVSWVNQQDLAKPITCLGDGHRGIWNKRRKI